MEKFTKIEDRLIGTGIKTNTAKHYVQDLQMIEKKLKKPIEQIQQTDLDKLSKIYKGKIPGEEDYYSTGTLRKYLFSIIAYAKAYKKTKLLEAAREAMPKYKPKKEKTLIQNPEEFLQKVWLSPPPASAARKRTQNPFIIIRDKMMLVFDFFFANRREELTVITVSDVDFEKKIILIPDLKSGGKYDIPQTSEFFWQRAPTRSH